MAIWTTDPILREMSPRVGVLLGALTALFGVPTSAGAAETHSQANGSISSAGDTKTDVVSTHASRLPYMKRYLPEAQTFEFGLYTGALFVSPGHSLRSPTLQQQAYAAPVFQVGARLGYYPLAYLGFEGDLAVGEGVFAEDLSDVDGRLVANRGHLAAYRAQVIGQLPDFSLVPYGLLGVGTLGASSQAQGRNTDFVVHLGAGLKVPLNEGFALRAEFRENLHNRTNDRYAGIAFSEELNVGVAFRWGHGRQAPPDSDRDGLDDASDACPTVASLSPNRRPPA